MPSLKDIRARINSVKNTQQITRAMKMVSAAKLRRAQDQVINVRPYASKILSVISDIAASGSVEHVLLNKVQNPKKVLLVVITSDRGLCGGFNSSVCRYTERFLKTNATKYESMEAIFIGRKGADYFKRRNVKTMDVMTNLAKEISFELASQVADRIMKAFMSGSYDEVHFVYNEFKSAISQKLTDEVILPIDTSKSAFTSDMAKKSLFSQDLIFEPLPEEMLEQLLRQHFAVQVYRTMSESVCAEHAARMTAMENATKNAKEMIANLTLNYNKARQAAITKELIEICSGAEAVNA
jgi:F-type H+-transporting ATPase subunit gamma